MYRMLFALPLFVAAGVVGRARQAGVDAARLASSCSGLGFCGYYLASFLDFAGLQYISASLERLILYLNPTLVLLLGVLLFRRRVSAAQLGALAVSYCGVLLVFGHEVTLQGANVALGAALVFASALSYARLPGLQRRGGQAPGRLAPHRPGHDGGVRAVHRAVRCCCGRSSALDVAPQVLWLSVLNATCAPSRRC